MLEHAPFRVGTRARLYTSRADREQIGVTDGSDGRGTVVDVGIIDVDRSPEWGTYGESVTFRATLQSDGVVQIPSAVYNRLDLCPGETVRVSMVPV